jgi:hypothetical protein
MMTEEWVFSYGCQKLDRLVRVGLPERPASSSVPVAIECPCGESHRVRVMPRKRRRGECVDVQLDRQPPAIKRRRTRGRGISLPR